MIQVEIYRDGTYGLQGYYVRFARSIGQDEWEILSFEKDGRPTFTKWERGAIIPPSMMLTMEELKALGDAIAELGIKTDSDMKREGLLEATKFHLEDMRRLVFKEDKP